MPADRTPSSAPATGTVAIVGLGYVGLPLAVAFGRTRPTIGFDLDAIRVAQYREYLDASGEVSSEQLRAATHLTVTTDPASLAAAGTIIVAVPTPVDAANVPDLMPLRLASQTIGARMRPGTTVVYESTVFPGCTEEVCVPELERASGLTWGRDFFVGYSPERVNPGDPTRRLETIVKVVAGDRPETLDRLAEIYGSIVTAGIHRAPSIKVAEAAKVIENTQRDLNIALMNELAILFKRLELDTAEVLAAAGTKWNFLPFRPGLVGGHCIGVDPYYLTHKAAEVGYHPEVILAGRRINDGMGTFVATECVRLMAKLGCRVAGARVRILGLTFKEDCADLRNTRVVDIVRELGRYGIACDVTDPIADPDQARREYGIDLVPLDQGATADAVIAAVAHRELVRLTPKGLAALAQHPAPFLDVKSAFDRNALEAEGFTVWRL